MKIRDCLITSLMAFAFITVSVIAFAIWGPEPPQQVCLEPLNCFMVTGGR